MNQAALVPSQYARDVALDHLRTDRPVIHLNSCAPLDVIQKAERYQITGITVKRVEPGNLTRSWLFVEVIQQL